MIVNDNERRVAYAAQFQANASVDEIAKAAKVRTHVAQYSLKKLKEREIIRPWALLNLFALGFQEYKIYFSLAMEQQRQRTALLKALQREPSVVWFAELAGDYQYAIAVCARSGEELMQILEDFSKRYKNPFFKKQIVQLVTFTAFRKKYLVGTPSVSKKDMVQIKNTTLSIELDEIDYRLLSALYKEEYRSQEAIGRSEGLARSTASWRLRRLEKSGIIARYLYHISAVRFNMQVFTFLIDVRGISAELREKLQSFCLKHPNVVNLGQCLGDWDFEVTIEVPEAKQALSVAEKLSGQCGADIRDIRALSILQHRGSNNLKLQPPAESLSSQAG